MESDILMLEQRSQVRASLLERRVISENGRQGEGRAGSAACSWQQVWDAACEGMFAPGMLPTKGTFARIIYTWKATLFIFGVISPYT